MEYDVFVSYSSKDKAVADAIVASLEAKDIRCWYAPRDIPPGGDWAQEIAASINEAAVFLLIFSENANQSQRVLDELNLAINKEAVILPFRIENLDPVGAMQLHLSARHWLDAFNPSWKEYLDGLSTVIDSILEGDTRKLSSVAKTFEEISRRKKRKRQRAWFLAIAGLIAVFGLATYYFLPGLLSLFQQPTPTPNPTETRIAVQPTQTITPAPTEPPIGSVENPLIMMFYPGEIEFDIFNTAAEKLIAEIHQRDESLNIRVIPSSSMEAVGNALCNGDAHVGFLDAITYLAYAQDNCAVEARLVWAAYEDIKYGGEFIVNSSNEELQSLADIEGKRLCVPDFNSMSGWILPSLEIIAEFGDPFAYFSEINEVGSHTDVVEGVYYQDCDVGTAYYDVRESRTDLPDVMDRVRIIHRTTFIPNTNITFAAELDANLTEKLISDFISLSSENPDLAVISGQNAEMTFSLIEINDYYYSDLRKLFERAGEDPGEY